MPNEDNRPEFLSLDRHHGSRISQRELAYAAHLEEAICNTHAELRTRLRGGAVVEPGDLTADPFALSLPMPRGVRHGAGLVAPHSSQTSARNEPSFDGGLTFAEQRMLRDLQVSGRFDARRLHAIVDRIEQIGSELFSDQREQMAVSGCFTMASALKLRCIFALRVRRARLMIELHDLGIKRVRGCVVEGLFDLNRCYFRVRAQQI